MNTPHIPLAYGRGFTLIEVLIGVAIASILLSASLPTLGAMVDSIRLSSMSNSFLSQLYLARSEAIKRNGKVVMCQSQDGLSCATGGSWEQGWIVFHDVNNNSLRDPSELVIQHTDPMPKGFKIVGNQNVSHYISFHPTGETKMTSGGFQAGTITMCRQSLGRTEARQIVISSVGRPRVLKTTAASC